MKMPFGKYENWEVASVPIDYHVWLWTYVPLGDASLKEAVRREILAAGVHDEIPRTSVNGNIRPSSFFYGNAYPPPNAAPEPPAEAPPRGEKPREAPHAEQRVEVIYQWEKGIPPDYKQTISKIVEKGYRQVAMKKHPDRGGSIEEFNHLQEVISWLRKQLK